MIPGKLQQEIGKKFPFESQAQEAYLSLVRTADVVEIRAARLLRDFGLTASQYNILRILRGSNGALPILDIAARTITVVPGITGLIDRLEKLELVERERSTSDRRVVLVSITQKALDLLAQIDEPLVRLHDEIAGHMSEEELQELIRLLDRLREPNMASAYGV